MKYLGLPLSVSFKSRAIWDGVVERMEKRLATWKKIYLSKREKERGGEGGVASYAHQEHVIQSSYILSFPLSVTSMYS
jgi:hypothetical protein